MLRFHLPAKFTLTQLPLDSLPLIKLQQPSPLKGEGKKKVRGNVRFFMQAGIMLLKQHSGNDENEYFTHYSFIQERHHQNLSYPALHKRFLLSLSFERAIEAATNDPTFPEFLHGPQL